ncbi:uncharacterized protein LOC101858744 [Aplysia californica]|uniref:Uncharacterized protein LOC101858744 n=1 Tax=Aplysia californica TaxID=6500 RepID=A0ABM0K6Z8_APLCA|nr:uncharacterized protein LOC101858744 [Aplysia californica]
MNTLCLMVITIALFATVVQSACPPDNVIEYVTVSEDNYDRNFSKISEDGKRPLGFAKSRWYYNRPDKKNPCIKISGATDRRVEIMVEAELNARLCYKTQTSSTFCFFGQQWRCIPSRGDDVYIEFFCDDQCEEHDVRFWYRIVLGVTPAEDPEDHWCEGRNQDEFPANLLRLPDGFKVPTETTTPFNLASAPTASYNLLALLSFLTFLCYKRR